VGVVVIPAFVVEKRLVRQGLENLIIHFVLTVLKKQVLRIISMMAKYHRKSTICLWLNLRFDLEDKENEMLLCKDCKHCRPPRLSYSFWRDVAYIEAECQRFPRRSSPSVVTGHIEKKYIHCNVVRFLGECGLSGKGFEAKKSFWRWLKGKFFTVEQ
jgi:hypothetical protein